MYEMIYIPNYKGRTLWIHIFEEEDGYTLEAKVNDMTLIRRSKTKEDAINKLLCRIDQVLDRFKK